MMARSGPSRRPPQVTHFRLVGQVYGGAIFHERVTNQVRACCRPPIMRCLVYRTE
jgi:hypothetical protein